MPSERWLWTCGMRAGEAAADGSDDPRQRFEQVTGCHSRGGYGPVKYACI